MMKKNKNIFALLTLLVMLFAFSCGEEDKDPVTVRVFSYGSSFSGWYVLNGDSPEFFTEEIIKDSGINYFEKTLDDLDEVEVEVTSDDPVSSMAIRIYQDDEKVKEVSQESTYEKVIMRLNLSYTYGESDDEDKNE